MASIAESTYPQIVWRNRTKKLWNPIHKKALKNLPEERVRLRVIDYLVHSGWSKHRISTEEDIGAIGDTSLRTDIICYSQQFEPRLLVECKAEHVPISSKTAEQVARYNQKVNAPYLLMTNGITDLWYAIDQESGNIKERQKGPDFLSGEYESPEYDFSYWKSRGFAGSKAAPGLQKWIEQRLPDIWFPQDKSAIRFLNFGEGPTEVDLSHYYRILSVSENRRLAVTTLNTAYGGNRMVIILNESNENRAVLELNMDLLFDEKKGNSALYSKAGIRTFDLNDYWSLQAMTTLEELLEQANSLFSEYVE